MAGTNERFTVPEQMWFDPANPEPLHDALRLDYARTRATAERRPSLRRHMQSCTMCLAIAAAVADSVPPTAGRKRIKLVLSVEMMHRLLQLPPHFEIVHMFAEDDPNMVMILVAGEGLPETPPLDETPIANLRDVAQGTTHTES